MIINFFLKINIFYKKYILKRLQYQFEEFIPNSISSSKTKNDLIKTNINQMTENLKNISEFFNTVEVENILNLNAGKDTTNKLKELFNKYGSDKVSHGYHNLYSHIFSNLKENPTIFEIGIGSNNKLIPSNMGPTGKPGASLFAFSEYFPKSKIFGADIDKSILFKHKNIETFYLDQNLIETYNNSLIKSVNFDLIIDDGLHMQSANLNSVFFALNKLNKGGYLVIEDISFSSLNIWRVLKNIIQDPFKLKIVKCVDNYVVIVKKIKT